MSRSWEFAKLSYRTLFGNPHLLIFPFISGIASILVVVSFFIPLEMTGTLDRWIAAVDSAEGMPEDLALYLTTFAFYFCSYFTIIFFNTALIASVMDIIDGRNGSLGMGLRFAFKRLPAIFAWSLVSAAIGMLLKSLERNEKIGRFVAGLLGSAWSALTFFVIPVIVTEGSGPYKAFTRSTKILRDTWGTALMGNFSLGTFGFLLMLPIILIGVLLGSTFGLTVALAVSIPLALLAILLNTAADSVFKAYLFAYATGEALPNSVDASEMSEAFVQR
ncbi:MAG: DUF6159 family protein [Opitutales bacterium]